MSLVVEQIINAENLGKDRVSSATCASLTESCPSPNSTAPSIGGGCPMRCELFEKAADLAGISQKVHQRAISWLITICWSKNLSQDVLWSTVQLFYIYKAKRNLPKEDL